MKTWPKCGHPRTPGNTTSMSRCRLCQRGYERKYRNTPKGKARNQQYEASLKGKARIERYRATAKGIFAVRRCQLNYSLKHKLPRLHALEALLAELGGPPLEALLGGPPPLGT
jgi:hypothetical protein